MGVARKQEHSPQGRTKEWWGHNYLQPERRMMARGAEIYRCGAEILGIVDLDLRMWSWDITVSGSGSQVVGIWDLGE